MEAFDVVIVGAGTRTSLERRDGVLTMRRYSRYGDTEDIPRCSPRSIDTRSGQRKLAWRSVVKRSVVPWTQDEQPFQNVRTKMAARIQPLY